MNCCLKRAAATKLVMVYLGDGVVDVHGGHDELRALAELVEAVHTSDALLHDAADHAEHAGVALQHQVRRVAAVVQDLRPRHNTVSIQARLQGVTALTTGCYRITLGCWAALM